MVRLFLIILTYDILWIVQIVALLWQWQTEQLVYRSAKQAHVRQVVLGLVLYQQITFHLTMCNCALDNALLKLLKVVLIVQLKTEKTKDRIILNNSKLSSQLATKIQELRMISLSKRLECMHWDDNVNDR